jgi:hypothetical protein
MSEGAQTPAITPPTGVNLPRRRISGRLWLSLLFSLGFYILMILFGMMYGPSVMWVLYHLLGFLPLGGILFGILGFRACARDPNLASRGFAIVCIVIGVLTLVHQSYQRYEMYPRLLNGEAVSNVAKEAILGLENREYAKILAVGDESFRAGRTGADLKAEIEAVLPPEGKLSFAKGGKAYVPGLDPDDKEAVKKYMDEEDARWREYFDGETGERDVEFHIRAPVDMGDPEKDFDIEVHMTVHVTRNGREEFTAGLSSLSVERASAEPDEPGAAGETEKPGAAGEPEKPDKSDEAGTPDEGEDGDK